MLKPALGLAAATAALTLGAAGSASAANLTSAYDFNNGLGASYSQYDENEPLSDYGTTANAIEVPHGPVRSFADDSGFFVPFQGGANTVAAFFNIDDADPNEGTPGTTVKLIDFSSFSADNADLYLLDGKIAYSNADGTWTEGPALGDNVWTQLVVTRENNGDRKVYQGDTLLFTIPAAQVRTATSEFVLFNDNENESDGSGGAVGRLRTWNGALTASEVGQIGTGVDAVAPSSLSFGDSEGTIMDGSTRWVGPWGYFGGTVRDDASVPEIEYELLNSSGGVVASRQTADSVFPFSTTGFNSVDSSWGVESGFAQFANDATGKLRVFATDARGNSTQSELDFKVDKQAPSGLSLNAIGETTSRKPTVSGKANVGPRDMSHLWVNLCKGATCDSSRGDHVGYARADIKDGSWSTGAWKRYDEATDREVDLGDQPNGDYVAQAWHSDAFGNEADAKQTLKIVDPKPAVVPPVVTPPTPPMPTLQQVMQRVMQNVVAQLRQMRIAALVRSGKVALPAQALRPATIIYQFFFSSAPKKVDPKAKAAQRKKSRKKAKKKPSNLIASGRKTFPAPGAGSVSVALTKAGKARIRRAKKAKIIVRQIVVPVGGPAVSQDAVVNMKR